MRKIKYEFLFVVLLIVPVFFMPSYAWLFMGIDILYLMIILFYERHYTEWLERNREYWMKKYHGEEMEKTEYL